MTTYSESEVPLPFPNFLIDPQDGEFTPYDARSLADPSESSHSNERLLTEPSNSFEHHSNLGLSPTTSTTRSRATSDALEKLLAVQAQQLSAIGQAWRAKYSLSTMTTTENGSGSALPAISSVATPASSRFKGKENWMNENNSFDSLSNKGSRQILNSSDIPTVIKSINEDENQKESLNQPIKMNSIALKELNQKQVTLNEVRDNEILDWLKNLSSSEIIKPELSD
ncbi:hypothetical protein CROQUDRAFT_652360 [Cronartium quercuum f. sp. fusiforme G11]|uniref:Uncharacterized protein n=1 Tax=Cronartium quercuum f. sp. fusiforme G11 TaxID=708437 RepID=A0A9P6NVS6_9BASI|nr:hypothetical protein CROQUDRAFT_652360 [Cronartium quercuum f. sp. fusiforme G11]